MSWFILLSHFNIFVKLSFIWVSPDITSGEKSCFWTTKPNDPSEWFALKAFIFVSFTTVSSFSFISIYFIDGIFWLYRFIFSKLGQILSLKRWFFRIL